MWVKNSGKNKCSFWACARALCRTVKVRGRNLGDVRDRRSSTRLSVQSAMNLATVKSCVASVPVTELLDAVHIM